MAAHFEKVSIPPMFMFDGFDPKVMYQMVPLSEERPMSIITEDEECTAIIKPEGIVKMQKFVFSQPLLEMPTDFRARLTPRNKFTFTLFGMKKGNATIFLVDRQGISFAALLVSVKSRVRKTVALCRLADMKRNCPWVGSTLPGILAAASKTFTNQANVEFTQHK